jgi:hypothetical protein
VGGSGRIVCGGITGSNTERQIVVDKPSDGKVTGEADFEGGGKNLLGIFAALTLE